MAILTPTVVCPASYLPQDGSSELDIFHGGAMGPDGSSVLAGTSGNTSVFLRRFGCGRYSEELFCKLNDDIFISRRNSSSQVLLRDPGTVPLLESPTWQQLS